MLAEARRGALVGERRFRHHHRRAHRGQHVAVAVVEIEPHAARDRLRVGEHLADRVDRAGRHAGGFAAWPAAARARTSASAPTIVLAQRRRGWRRGPGWWRSRDRRPGRRGRRRAQNLRNWPSLPTARMKMAVRDRQHLVGRDVGMRIAHLHRRLAGDEIVQVLVGRAPTICVSNSAMSMCWPSPVCFGVAQCGLDGDDRIEAGEDVGDGDADLLRLAAGSPVIDISPDMPWTMKS